MQKVVDETIINTLRKHAAAKRKLENHPIFVFSCGGNPEKYPSRLILEQFVADNEAALKNVFFMRAENISQESAMKDFDLLTQEALISDIADCLVIFAESVGSFCGLGAFAALPHTVSIASVVVERRHAGSDSFLVKGPVEVVKQCDAPLSETFYSNLKCPMENSNFTKYVLGIRGLVNKSESFPCNKGRKSINTSAGKIMVGSFAHELLDLITIFGPINEKDLLDLYCKVKRFKKRDLKIVSNVLEKDMRIGRRITIAHVLATMHATGLIGATKEKTADSPFFYSKVQLDHFFMFHRTNERDFQNMRAKVILRKRNLGGDYEKHLYRRFDSN